MGKEKSGFLTPKAIANRIKSKGLQKLRWYCQMCQKQCRDENGFKCHMMSESHQRQLLLFAEDPDQYIDTFSKDFKDGYTELLRRRFGTKRVQCNIVYQEYISERDHIHMNSTQWETLTDFIKWLGKEGICTVDYTEKGWFVQYIDRDPETIRKQEAVKVKERMALDDEERTARQIQEQVERAAREAGPRVTETEFTDLQRGDDEEKVILNLGAIKKEDSLNIKDHNADVSTGLNPIPQHQIRRRHKVNTEYLQEKTMAVENPFKVPTPWTEDAGSSTSSLQRQSSSKKAGEKRKSALDEIMEFEEKHKEKQNRKEYWLHEGIVVKVVSKKLGEKYHKKKAYVKSVENLFGGVIKMLDSGDKLKVDQNHLETVIPAQGKPVMIVNGAYRGKMASLTDINQKQFSCTVTLSSNFIPNCPIFNTEVASGSICLLYS